MGNRKCRQYPCKHKIDLCPECYETMIADINTRITFEKGKLSKQTPTGSGNRKTVARINVLTEVLYDLDRSRAKNVIGAVLNQKAKIEVNKST